MHFSTTTLASCLLLAGGSMASAQYGGGDAYGSAPAASPPAAAPAAPSSAPSAAPVSAPSSAPAAPGAQIAVHVVKVSNAEGKLVYDPADIKANVGDMVQYQFYPQNHSIVQSTFDKPCEPLEQNQPGSSGFFSGYQPVSKDSATMPTFTIMVKDTKPIWFYCSQGKHCQSGMVGVINAPATNSSRTLDTYKEGAKKAPKNVSPGIQCNNSGITNTQPAPAPAPPASSAASSGSASPATNTDTATVSPVGAAPTFTTQTAMPTLVSQANTTSSGGPLQVTTNAAPGLRLNSQMAGAGLVAVVVGLMM